MSASAVTIQKTNWRTSQARFVDYINDDGTVTQTPIVLTGATGYLVSTDPSGTSYKTAITLGKAEPVDAAAEAIDGYCYATFKGVAVNGNWSEQFQLVLPSSSEPLYSDVKKFTVKGNLTPP